MDRNHPLLRFFFKTSLLQFFSSCFLLHSVHSSFMKASLLNGKRAFSLHRMAWKYSASLPKHIGIFFTRKHRNIPTPKWKFVVGAVVSLLGLANFSPFDPLIFGFSPTPYAHSLVKNEFFSNIHGCFLREEQRKRNFQANEVSKRRSKKLFFTLFCALNQNCFAVSIRHRSETCKEKASLLLIKK